MEDIRPYIEELITEYNHYLQENANVIKEAINQVIPETPEMSEEDIQKNADLTEKTFYCLMAEKEMQGALGVLGIIKTKLELPQHAEAIN